MEKQSTSQNSTILKNQNKAFQAQNKLLEMLLEIARTESGNSIMLTTMRNALDSITEISGAEYGSLFLLDHNGMVTDSLLSNEEDVNPAMRNRLIGKVLNEGLAGWVKKRLELGIIGDTKTDSRWVTITNRPYQVRSAIAVPILRRGFLYGIITLMHSAPNYFNIKSAAIIQITADQLAVAIENTQLYVGIHNKNEELIKAKKEIEKISDALKIEIRKGQSIQEEFLPHKTPDVKGIQICTFFQPAMELSGDFYDFFMLPGNLLGIVLSDISDKGVGAALFMALVRSLIRVFSGHFEFYNSFHTQKAKQDINIEKVLYAVSLTNDYLSVEHGDKGMFATLFFGVLNPSTGELYYINCGHEPLMMIKNGDIKRLLRPTGPALGVFPGIEYEIKKAQLTTDEILLGFTDGVTEARSPKGHLYTRKRLKLNIEKSSAITVNQLVNSIKKDLFQFINNAPQADDITIFAVQKKDN